MRYSAWRACASETLLALGMLLVAACTEKAKDPTAPESSARPTLSGLSTTGVRIVDLGSLGGNFSEAIAVNDSGTVVGFAQVPEGNEHAFVWTSHTGLQDLGTFGGTDAELWAVNDVGTAVGRAFVAAEQQLVPIIWSRASGGHRLPVPARWRTCVPFAINHFGTVVGVCDCGVGVGSRAVMWPPGGAQPVNLGALPTSDDANRTSVALGIDIHTTVVGYSSVYFADLGMLASLATIKPLGESVRRLFPQGVPGGYFQEAQAISPRSGYVVGRFVPAPTSNEGVHAFYWDGRNPPVMLGSLVAAGQSDARAVSDDGLVAGVATDTIYFRAFWWRRGEGIHSLGALVANESSWGLGVNDRHMVVGWSGSGAVQNNDRVEHAVMWMLP
jgi:probable HAF family extracellular repeat protein